MTTTAIDPGAAAFALANKKQKEAMGARVLATSGKGWSFVKSAPSRLKAGVSRLLKTFKLDAAADAVWGFGKRVLGYARTAITWVADLLGLRNLVLFAVTHRPTRKAIGNAVAATAMALSRRVAWTEHQIGRLPWVGGYIKRGIMEARIFTMKWLTKALHVADRTLDNIETHRDGGYAVRTINSMATLSMTQRVLARYVPATMRRPLLFTTIAVAAARIGMAVYSWWKSRNVETEKRELVEAVQAEGGVAVELTGKETKAERDAKIQAAATAAEATRTAAEAAGKLPGAKVVKGQHVRA